MKKSTTDSQAKNKRLSQAILFSLLALAQIVGAQDFRTGWLTSPMGGDPANLNQYAISASLVSEAQAQDLQDFVSNEEQGFPEDPWSTGPERSWQPSGGLHLRVGWDLRDLFTKPRHMSPKSWRRLGYGILAIAAVRAVDEDLRNWIVTDDQGSADFAESVRPFGQEQGLALLGAAWLGSRLVGHDGLRATTEDALEASLISALVMSGTLKQLTGRTRPNGGSLSFPSGDTTQTFAIASVIAHHSRKKWVGALAYSAAGLVAWERVRLNRHWPSDVAAGALLGWATGRWVVRRNRGLWGNEKSRLSVMPRIGNGTYGAGLRYAF